MAVYLKSENENLVAQLYDCTYSDSTTTPYINSEIFLGIALNNSYEGELVYVCTTGITTVKINATEDIIYGDYGILQCSLKKGYLTTCSKSEFSNEIPIAGYFLETNNAYTHPLDKMILFYVKNNF